MAISGKSTAACAICGRAIRPRRDRRGRPYLYPVVNVDNGTGVCSEDCHRATLAQESTAHLAERYEYKRFIELRAELQRRSRQGALTLTPAESDIVLEGLVRAGDYGPLRIWHDRIVKRDLWAGAALSSGETDGNKRARIFLNRMQGKPDRSAVPKPSARYDAARIVAHYRALTRQEGADHLEADATIWDSSLALPLSPGEALVEICRIYHFSTEPACHKWLERHGALAPRHRRSR